MNEMSADAILSIWKQEEEKHKIRFGTRFASILGVLLLVTIACPLASFGEGLWWNPSPLFAYCMEAIVYLAPLLLFLTFLPPRHRRMVAKLADTEDIRAINPLLTAFNVYYLRPPVPLVRTLTRLLWHLQPSDHALLSEIDKDRLYRSLNSNHATAPLSPAEKTDYRLAVLHAIETIGDEKALPYVEQTAKPENSEASVQEAAARCLLFLREQMEQQKAGKTLLRPTEAPAEPSTLLKPIAAEDSLETATLLRPAP